MTTRRQRITWTGLPNGIYQDSHGNRFLRVSILVSPRLYSTASAETLADYTDFLKWPQLVNAMHFSVTFSNGGPPRTVNAQIDPTRPKPDTTYYGGLFVAATPVTPYQFDDLSNRFIISHPAQEILNFLQTSYQLIGSQTSDGRNTLPSIYHIANLLNPNQGVSSDVGGPLDINDLGFQRGTYIKQLKNQAAQLGHPGAVSTAFTPPPPGTLPNLSTRTDMFSKLRYFHYRDGTKQNPSLPGQKPQQTEPDFHQALSALTKHPTLERYLGFVIDLLVPVNASIPQTGNPPVSDAWLQVNTSWTSSTYTGAANAAIRPKVHYIYDGADFLTRPANTDLAGRWLNLPNGAFALSQIDVDGGALKLSNFVATTSQSIWMRNRLQVPTEAIPSQAGLPTLRTAGFQLLKQDRALDLADAFKLNQTKNTQAEGGADPDMHAEDVTLGYRPDIFDTITNAWHSLVRREGTYTFLLNGKTLVINEEGFISLGVTENPADSSSPKNLYMHEGIFRWTGWSLAVPLPGDPAQTGDTPPPSPAGPGTNFKLGVDWTNGGSYSSYKTLKLPRLRFGKGYRVRARAVDLAGNSLDPGVTDAAHAIPSAPAAPEQFYRWEPVASPPLALADDISRSPGENLERFVVRSDYGVESPNYPAAVQGYGLSYYGTAVGDTIDFLPTSERHVYPPKTSEEMSERHGMFDDPKVSAAVKLVVDDYDNINGSHQGIVSLDGTLPQDAGTLQGKVVVAPGGNENNINIGYLPDVLARGAAFAPAESGEHPGLPGDNPIDKNSPSGYPQPYLTFTGWPFARPFLVRLNGLLYQDPLNNPVPTKKPHWDATNRILDIYLAQSETWTMQLSSFFDPADLNLFGVWKWVTDYFNAVDGHVPPDVMNQALYGLFWMLSPWRLITLIHPVQRPLVIPTWKTLLGVKETIGQTWADLFNADFSNPGTIQFPPVPVHGTSTIKLDVYGDWMMPIDDGKDPNGFFTITSHDHVVNAPVAPTDTGVFFDAQHGLRQHKFHDTKYRKVSYTAVATTRFKEYFGFSDADIAGNPKASITQTSPPAVVHVQNSRRPDAPKVLYVLPAFQWDPTTHTAPTTLESDRHGGWVRVWMERPWYSSGDGEQLGVVVMALHDTSPAAAKRLAESKSAGARLVRALGVGPKLVTVPDYLKSYVTQWGTDLTRPGAVLRGSPVADAFPKANFIPLDEPQNFSNIKFDNLSIAEVAGASVAVAPHDVHFDPKRQLWYCDIQMSFGKQYYPFVRMALARFQPRSLNDTHLSKIIQADFVQLAPDRFASVSYQYGGDPRKVHVAVTGPAYSSAAGGGPGTTMEVILEQQQANAEGDLAWVPVPHGVYQMAGSVPIGPGIPPPFVYLWQTGANGLPDITLPRPQGQIPYRLIIKEYESFIGEQVAPSGPAASVGGLGVRRVVYVASVDI